MFKRKAIIFENVMYLKCKKYIKNKEWRDYENAIKNLKKIFIKF